MIKTLRITTIIAAALAVVFLVLPAVYGFRGDEGVEKLLKAPGAVEQFKKAKGARAKEQEDQTPPLVQQAEAFALYLDPPPASTPERPRTTREPRETAATIRKTPETKPKFKLIGTSVYASRPDQSLALIDEPGSGLAWVSEKSKVGHLTIEHIKDGVLVVKGSEKSYEVTIETVEEGTDTVASLPGESESKPAVVDAGRKSRGRSGSSARAGRSRASRDRSSTSKSRVSSRAAAAAARGKGRGVRPTSSTAKKPPSTKGRSRPNLPASYDPKKSEAMMEQVIEELGGMMRQSKSPSRTKRAKGKRPPPRTDAADSMDQMKKLLSTLETMKMGAKESKNIGDLGRQLEDARSDPERRRGGSKVEGGSGSSKK